MSLRAHLAALLVSAGLISRAPASTPAWTVDRDGRVRLPARRIELRARA